MIFHDPRNAFMNFMPVYAELYDYGDGKPVWVFVARREEIAGYREHHLANYGTKPLAAVKFRRKPGPEANAALDRMFALHPDLEPPPPRGPTKRIPIEPPPPRGPTKRIPIE